MKVKFVFPKPRDPVTMELEQVPRKDDIITMPRLPDEPSGRQYEVAKVEWDYSFDRAVER